VVVVVGLKAQPQRLVFPLEKLVVLAVVGTLQAMTEQELIRA
jgi:hypothetical protein